MSDLLLFSSLPGISLILDFRDFTLVILNSQGSEVLAKTQIKRPVLKVVVFKKSFFSNPLIIDSNV